MPISPVVFFSIEIDSTIGQVGRIKYVHVVRHDGDSAGRHGLKRFTERRGTSEKRVEEMNLKNIKIN